MESCLERVEQCLKTSTVPLEFLKIFCRTDDLFCKIFLKIRLENRNPSATIARPGTRTPGCRFILLHPPAAAAADSRRTKTRTIRIAPTIRRPLARPVRSQPKPQPTPPASAKEDPPAAKRTRAAAPKLRAGISSHPPITKPKPTKRN